MLLKKQKGNASTLLFPKQNSGRQILESFSLIIFSPDSINQSAIWPKKIAMKNHRGGKKCSVPN